MIFSIAVILGEPDLVPGCRCCAWVIVCLLHVRGDNLAVNRVVKEIGSPSWRYARSLVTVSEPQQNVQILTVSSYHEGDLPACTIRV